MSTQNRKSRIGTGLLSLAGTVYVASSAMGAPAWYGATGGFIANTNNPAVAAAAPTIPDLYQHQNWVPRAVGIVNGQTVYAPISNNGWESSTLAAGGSPSGWCGYTSYSDIFYDLQSQGYVFTNLANGTNGNWFTANYGAAGTPLNSNVAKVANYFARGGTMQGFLNAYTNYTASTDANGNKLNKLGSQNFTVNPATGKPLYYSFSAGGYVSVNNSVFNFTNNMLRRGEDVSYILTYGTNTPVNNPSTQNFWWANHVVAVSGISTATNSVYVADPDSNGGPGPANEGWIRNNPNFPGALASVAGAPLPVPALNSFDSANATDFNSNYDRFQFNSGRFGGYNNVQVVTSPDAPQFNNTFLNTITVTGPSLVKAITATQRGIPSAIGAGAATPAVRPAGGTDELEDLTLSIPEDSSPIDAVEVQPATPVVAPSIDPTADSLVDDTTSAPGETWSVADDSTDPFGNTLADGSVQYDLTQGDDLMPGDTVDLDLATTSDFSTDGYDVLIHFAGDPSDEWTPEVIGGSEFDPSDVPAADLDASSVPEPTTLSLVVISGLGLLARHRRPIGR